MKRKAFFNLIRISTVLFLFLLGTLINVNANTQKLPSPQEFFGFKMGTDGKLAGWQKIVEYFKVLDMHSDRIMVKTLGESTLGNPFIVVIISEPENLENLEKYRKINKKLADPRGLSDTEIDQLINEGKYISVQTYSLHATEVGGTQCTPELAYGLAVGDDAVTKKILKNTIFLIIPCFNPDGLNMVKEWFYKYKGTEFDNTRLPYLYHFYTGHDNNRDSYQLTQKESRMFAKLVYRDWVPQSYVDHHHFGSSGARFYIPPYLDPIHPNVDPLIWREHQLYGAHMAVALENAGKSGIESGAPFTGWWQASFHMSTNYHNISGMLTESASAKWADPIYILPDQLEGTRGRPEYKPQMTMPRLWKGGWWRLRDIVEQKIIASKAVLELGARYKNTLLFNTVQKARGNIKSGKTEPPFAFIIPRDQHDFLTAVKLAWIFQMNGIEIHGLEKDFQMGSRMFSRGSFVILCAQPMRAFILSFLEQVNYPDNAWTRSHGDREPLRPYDLTTYSVSEHMGVEAIPILEPLPDIHLSKIREDILPPEGRVEGTGERGFIFEHRYNDSFKALNRLLKKGMDIYWVREGFRNSERFFPAGTIFVRSGSGLASEIQILSRELGMDFFALKNEPPGKALKLKQPRLGIYKRYSGGNMDAGWTDWLLTDFEFQFTPLFNKDIQNWKKIKNYDVIVIPSDSYKRIKTGLRERRRRGGMDTDEDNKKIPPEYRGGIGEAGEKNLKKFVEDGGTLIVLNGAYDFAQKAFKLPVQNSIADIPRNEFYCPGSTVKINIDTFHPLGYGMPANSLALFRNSPILQVSAGDFKDGVAIPVRYVRENILQSGWLIGEKYLSEKPAVVEFRVQKGKIVIFAFPVQHRAQTHGTFKLFFNAIYYGASGSNN
ncbi:MAG: peptidase M14 family protein [Candidatus Aminicenantes bacterium]|nr:peptidase M14 family protein [Candidatus Aminicenantes bacterium]NIM80238.1 peptidase M14 family protein [Candidatus Aminicenantes bacterium]NIN19588.1 peptidase M14 family protein [Candidatus Aminicenantes bacterium]NIN43472.1 peptidase M14 family protein [Candidatus Aminicenantes bacterium]NIN86217.1 peptidase M14 family protein [Candidatus Aminicenantes bacterium]